MEDDVRYTRRELLAAGSLLCLGAASTLLSALTRRDPPWPTLQVQLNAADEDELRCVPGIGAASAAAIVSARPFGDLSELEPLLGPARLEQARPHLRLE
ncbi:MAG: helix-hairpin-helix domain-containing protein [Planctomycetota bacterium]